tara:strand:+ start:1102 stop:1470 length:369 start_codon:yes stop_codon:yes gene_type:complete
MKKELSRIFSIYILIIGLILLFSSACSAQVSSDGIQVVQFNADWNTQNGINYLPELKDCKTSNLDISVDNIQAKYKIAIVPTIVIFDDGEEIDRFQADLSFKLAATRKEVQEVINEIIMSKF